MFENLQSDASIQNEADTLGGFAALESDGYAFTIDMAYVDQSTGGAMSLNLAFKDQNGNALKQTLWMTSGTAKGCKNYYVDKKENKRYLPGFSQANAICLLAIGKEIGALTPEDKVINLWDFDAGKEMPQTKKVLMDLIGQEITLGVLKIHTDVTAKDNAGNYVPNGETKHINEIDKVFRTADHLTAAEIRAEAKTASFYDKWVEKNRNVTREKVKGAPEGGAGVTTVGGTAVPPADSIFAQNK